MEKKNKVLRIGVLSLCLTLFLGLSAQAKTGVPLIPKSKSKALSYSLVGTLAPMAVSIPLLKDGGSAGIALGSFGLLVGPGLGHLYAENSGHFVSGMFIRGAVGVIAIYSMSEIDILEDDMTGPVIGFLIGGSVVAVSTIYDIATTSKSVDRYNQKHGFTQVDIKPYYLADHQTLGLSIGVTF